MPSNQLFSHLLVFGAGSIAAYASMILIQAVFRRKRLRWTNTWKVGTHQPIPYNRIWKAWDPAELKKSGDLYGLMISAVVPRPIALVTSQDLNGVLNCAPFSYFNMVSHDPPLVVMGLCINGRTKTKKDTLTNIEATGK